MTSVLLKTTMGDITIQLASDMPITAGNFQTLVQKGFYDGVIFHRVIPGFMVQGGDPKGTGMGGPGYTIKGEMNGIPHTRGVLSMARSQDRDSAGSQFFITVADVPSLNPGGMGSGSDGYTVFGQVISGMDVVDKIVALPAEQEIAIKPVAIKKVTIAKWPVKVR
jgi:peptidyl-prolyl cis-trans isomerase B (cyclophilin B)